MQKGIVMPIKIPNALPATRALENENIFVMTENRALQQDIRPLKIVILNLMPTKIATETQLLRLLGNTPLQIEVELMQTATYQSKNVSPEHLLSFYKTFDEIKQNRYDGLIVTGAPVENMEFEEVAYWDELCEILDWADKNVYSTFHICWGAIAGLYHKYNIKKSISTKKLFGVFEHETLIKTHPLLRGFDDTFFAPHSRYFRLENEEVLAAGLDVLTFSGETGVHICADRKCRNFFVTGHGEYDRHTLANEYERDVNAGMNTAKPVQYFPNDDPRRLPVMNWRAHSSLMFSNWINYIVYQRTPYDLSELNVD